MLCAALNEMAGFLLLYLSEDFAVFLKAKASTSGQDTLVCCHQSCILGGGVKESSSPESAPLFYT